MSNVNNPTSPHLQIYAPQLTSVLSILHRFTGIGFVVALCLTTCWLYALSQGEAYYLTFCDWLVTPLGKLIFYTTLTSVYYHLLNGVRYLLWSLGEGFELSTVYNSGWIVAALVFTLTLITVFFV